MKMTTYTETRHKRTILNSLQRRLLLVVILLCVCFLIVQFGILSTVGTLGPKISAIRKESDNLALDNEMKLAQIHEYQTNGQVQQSAVADLQMHPTTVKYITSINLSTTNTIAQK